MADRQCTKCGKVFSAPCRLKTRQHRKTPCTPIVLKEELSETANGSAFNKHAPAASADRVVACGHGGIFLCSGVVLWLGDEKAGERPRHGGLDRRRNRRQVEAGQEAGLK
jgi:hypothetical protein